MSDQKLITHQFIDPKKLERARELRHAMTPAERLLWGRLRNNQLGGYHFRRQQVVGPYIVDFFCNPSRLVIEIDGDVHIFQCGYDRERQMELEALELRVIRFSNDQVENNLDTALQQILAECKRFI